MVPGCIPFDRTTDPEPLGQLLTQAHERGMAFSGVVWRASAPGPDESSADVAARIETEIANLLSAVHAVQRGAQDGSVELPGGLWIVTERAVACESGEPVDPVQAALWGFGRTTINEEPALRCKLVDCDGSPEAVEALGALLTTPVDEPELPCAKGSCSRRGCCTGRAAVISRCRDRPTSSWRPANAARSTTCGSPRRRCRRRPRATCR